MPRSTMPAPLSKKLACLVPLVAGAFLGLAGLLFPFDAGADDKEALWTELRREIFGAREIVETTGAVTLYAPENAQDAALLPVSIRIPAATVPHAVALTLIVDTNPAPVAATFTFGDGFREGDDVGERSFETRLRLDSFSNVRAVLETADGTLHMSSRYVIGAGGCSAAPSKDPEAALADVGRIDIRTTAADARGTAWRETQVMIRHPNFTGLQMDPISRGYVPARFVNALEVSSGGKLLFRMEGGISISENPHFRFSYGAAGDEAVEVKASDTAGAQFTQRSQTRGS